MTLTPPVSERDHVQGLATAAITLVEYGDYQGPQCAAAQPWIKALQALMGDRLRLVFRHFPVSSLPPHAAEAAEAAGLQDRFWGMHDTLFEHQSALGNGHLVEYARDLGLDTNRFLRDMTEHVSAERVRLDLVSGVQSGVQNTPTFFVNGVRQLSSWEGDDSRAAIEKACAAGYLLMNTSNEEEPKTMSSVIIDTIIDPLPLSFDQTVVAGYRSHGDAETAVRLLAKDGLLMDKISIIGRNFETREEVQGFYRPADAALEGAGTGAWFGGLFGLLIGTGLFILPVLGPVFVLGPLAGLVAGAISGAGVGALINGLVSLGVPQDQAIKYQKRIQAGEFLVVVHGATTAETERACSLLQDTSQTGLQTHSIFHSGVV